MRIQAVNYVGVCTIYENSVHLSRVADVVNGDMSVVDCRLKVQELLNAVYV